MATTLSNKETLQDDILNLQIQQTQTGVDQSRAIMAYSKQLISYNPAPARQIIGSGSDSLGLTLSEDMLQGVDAQVTIMVDGKQIGGTETITAIHAAGQTQLVTVEGTFGLGTHTVSVNFLNDGYNGGIQDRNAYVGAANGTSGVSYDGAVQSAGALSLKNNGAQSFQVTSATTYSPGAAGGSLTTLGNDKVVLGTGAETISAMGPSVSVTGSTGAMTFVAHAGADSIVGGMGTENITQGTGSLALTVGGGAYSVSYGQGQDHATFDITKGAAGGNLVVGSWTPGNDVIHLHGYTGTGIASQSIGSSSSVFNLTDGTSITVGGHNVSAASVFG